MHGEHTTRDRAKGPCPRQCLGPQAAAEPDLTHRAESARRAGVSYAKLIERIVGLGLQWQPSRMA